MSFDLSRRNLLELFAATPTGLVGCAAPPRASTTPTPPTAAPSVELVPLPFAAGGLKGLSERLIVSHHENNYGGAVRNLAACGRELAVLREDAPGFVVAALRERELTFRNSKILHEAYFGNLGGDGKPSGAITKALGDAFGSAAAWEQRFRAAAKGLAGGSGWVVLAFDPTRAALEIVASGNHTQALAGGLPLLVLDMYEHAYHLDYGAEAARYIDAVFANLRWQEVEGRYQRALRVAAAWAT
jgi:superoxide dismutase, Fe-Mn family